MTDSEILDIFLTYYNGFDLGALAVGRAIEQVARREALEGAGKVCDEWQRTYVLEQCCDHAQHAALKSAAAAIRALMGEEG